jgi:hypothetical protein
MKKVISKIRDWIEDRLRSICAPMGPGTRILVIVILIVVFAAINFYITFKAIYNIGREDKKQNPVSLPVAIPDMEPEYAGEPDELQKEMEDFFNEHFNSEQNDRTEE